MCAKKLRDAREIAMFGIGSVEVAIFLLIVFVLLANFRHGDLFAYAGKHQGNRTKVRASRPDSRGLAIVLLGVLVAVVVLCFASLAD